VLTLPIREIVPATPRARIVRIDLRGHPFSFLPGQAVLIGGSGLGGRRPYSIASAPEDADRDRAIELLVGVDEAGAAGAHLRLEEGALVDLEGPIGRFTFPHHPAEKRFAFIAGGTGIAPLRAMLRHALNVEHESIGLLYSARTVAEFAYEDELRTLARHGAIELTQTVTRDVVADDWRGARGRIGRRGLEALVHDPATLCFVCGPPALVAEVPRLLEDLSVAPQRIRVEEWEPRGARR
jgi:ferredoxin-NADP reductase